MQSTIFEAGETVRGLWNEIQNTQVEAKEGHLDIAGAVKTVTKKAREKLNLGAVSDIEVLNRLQQTLVLASKSSEARSAVIGIARLLKDLGTLGHAEKETSLMQTARKVSNEVLQKMAKGFFPSLIMSLQSWLSEILTEAHILPAEYRSAIERALKPSQDAFASSEPHQIRFLCRELHDIQQATETLLSNPEGTRKQKQLLKKIQIGLERFINSFQKGIKLFDEAESLEREASTALAEAEKTLAEREPPGLADRIQELGKLEQSVAKHMRHGLLPPTLLARIRIDLACYLTKQQPNGPNPRVLKLVDSVKNQLPIQLRKRLLLVASKDEEMDTRLGILKDAREFVHKGAAIFENYDKAIKLLEQLHAGTKDKNSLGRDERKLLKEFLAYARANKQLNESLWAKEDLSPVEDLICSFTHVTLVTVQPQGHLGKVTNRLSDLGIPQFLDAFQGAGNDEQKQVVRKLDKYISIGDEQQYEGKLYESLLELRTWIENNNPKKLGEFDKKFRALFPCDAQQKAPLLNRFDAEHERVVSEMAHFVGEPIQGKKKVPTALKAAREGLTKYSDRLQTAKEERIHEQEGRTLGLDDYITEYEKKHQGYLYDSLVTLKTWVGKNAKEDLPKFTETFQTLFPLDRKNAPPGSQAKGTDRFSAEHANAVLWLSGYVKEISKGKEKVPDAIVLARTELHQYSTLLQSARDQRDRLIDAAEHAKKAIDLADLRVVEQYADVNELFKLLPDDEDLGGQIEQLRESATQASTIAQKLDYAMQVLPSYEPGDLLFDEEGRMKAYKRGEEKGSVYSEIPLSLSNAVRVFKDTVSKGVFATQGFWTRSKYTHVEPCVSLPDDDGTVLKQQIGVTTPCRVTPIDFFESVWITSLRPDFDKVLTAEAKEALKEAWGINYQDELARRYSRLLTEFVCRNREVLEENVQNDPYKGAVAFIDSLPDILVVNYKKRLKSIVESFAPKKEAKPLDGEDLKETFSTRMFCSEFSGAVLMKVLEKLNVELVEELPALKQPKAFIDQVFISPDKLPRLHPGALANQVGAYYTEAKRPVLTRLLLGQK